MGRRINRNRDGYSMAVVKVADVNKVIEVTDQITALGYQAYTPQSFVQGINSFYVVLQVIFGGVGAIALLVAAIGIANTMVISVLERRSEIGLRLVRVLNEEAGQRAAPRNSGWQPKSARVGLRPHYDEHAGLIA